MTELRIGCLYAIIAMATLIGYGFGIETRDTRPEAVEIVEEMVTEATITTSTTLSTTVTTMTESSTTMVTTSDWKANMTLLGAFTATYYKGNYTPCNGGSGRMLVSCYEKETSYKGSVASKYVYERYGYYLNDKTMVYIEFGKYPRLNGWYSVDDCNADPKIVDFYFADYSTCPWQNDGLTSVDVWIGGVE